MILINVTFALAVENELEAYDAVNEILREHQRHFTPASCLLDYAIGEAKACPEIESKYYEEGEMMGGCLSPYLINNGITADSSSSRTNTEGP